MRSLVASATEEVKQIPGVAEVSFVLDTGALEVTNEQGAGDTVAGMTSSSRRADPRAVAITGRTASRAGRLARSRR